MRRIPRLLAISDRHALAADQSLESWARALASAAVPALQLREKGCGDRELLAALSEIATGLGDASTLVLMNGRVDLAIAAGVAGVHLPGNGIPAAAVRRCFGDSLLLGCSCHHEDEVAQAAGAGVDYVLFGPVFATPSKRRYGPPLGLRRLEQAARHGLPVLAIGGIVPARLSEVSAAGAWGAAAIRAFGDESSAREMVDAAASSLPPVG